MTTIKSVVWAVTAHRSYKFGPYVTSVASKAHIMSLRDFQGKAYLQDAVHNI